MGYSFLGSIGDHLPTVHAFLTRYKLLDLLSSLYKFESYVMLSVNFVQLLSIQISRLHVIHVKR